MVTTIMPETHYSRYLLSALNKLLPTCNSVVAYVENDRQVSRLPGTKLIRCWSPGLTFPLRIGIRCGRDEIRLLHAQHEFNMYGGVIGGLLFPFMLLLARTRSRIVVTIHSVFARNVVDPEFLVTFGLPSSRPFVVLARLFFTYLFGCTAKLADAVIVHTETMRKAMTSYYGANPKKVRHIPLGVLSTPSPENNQYPSMQKRKEGTILYFGYVVRRKGIEYLIRAFAEISADYPDTSLVIAGGTLRGQQDYVGELKSQAAALGLGGRIRFTGFLSESEIGEEYRKAEVVVLPYLYSIAASLPLSLAVTFRRPVLATDLPNLAEEVSESRIGILVPPRDVRCLADGLVELLSNEELRNQLCRNEDSLARARSWDNVARLTVQTYEDVLGTNLLSDCERTRTRDEHASEGPKVPVF